MYIVQYVILLMSTVHVVTCSSGYINCTQGTLNVILAAPHGGYEEPASIPDRDAGCYINGDCVWNHTCGVKDTVNCKATTIRDSFTKELTELIADDLETSLGKSPTTVINNLKRSKLDANRAVDVATFGESIPEQAWNEFHLCISQAKDRIEGDAGYNGMGLFVDIHGHGHPNNWAELGYLIYSSKLNSNNLDADSSSIRHLSSTFQGNFDTLLRGNQSFGYYLEAEGYTAVPSPKHPGPNGEKYFSGGYNTRVHGSVTSGKIDALQIESSYTNRELSNRPAYARALANAIINFRAAHYPETSVTTTEQSGCGKNMYIAEYLYLMFFISKLFKGIIFH